MRTIYKYSVMPGRNVINMSRGAEILTVQMQRGLPYLWAIVENSYPKEERVIVIKATGRECDELSISKATYVGTFQMSDGDLVYHVFDAGVRE